MYFVFNRLKLEGSGRCGIDVMIQRSFLFYIKWRWVGCFRDRIVWLQEVR